MTLDEAAKEFEFDCKIRHLSPKTIDNYGKQLRYLQRFLEKEFSISTVEDVKPSHIKRFLSMMDDAGRKPQYINDLLKVFKTFFNYLEAEGHIEATPTKRIRNMKLPKLKLRTFTEKNILDMIDFYSGQSFVDIRNRAMIALMFDTGVRLSELMEMIESQIREDSIMIYGKGAKERVVPVSPFLEKALLRYSRALFLFLSMPLVLGSPLSFAVMLLYLPIIAKRIRNEERVLEDGLAGYAEYMKRVRYKVIPFVW